MLLALATRMRSELPRLARRLIGPPLRVTGVWKNVARIPTKTKAQALMGIGTDLLQLTNSCCPNMMNTGMMGPPTWTPEMTTKCAEEARAIALERGLAALGHSAKHTPQFEAL